MIEMENFYDLNGEEFFKGTVNVDISYLYDDFLKLIPENGNILDGYHRVQICGELGIKDYPKVIRVGMSESEKLTHARKLNIARRHLTCEQKRELIREQLKAT